MRKSLENSIGHTHLTISWTREEAWHSCCVRAKHPHAHSLTHKSRPLSHFKKSSSSTTEISSPTTPIMNWLANQPTNQPTPVDPPEMNQARWFQIRFALPLVERLRTHGWPENNSRTATEAHLIWRMHWGVPNLRPREMGTIVGLLHCDVMREKPVKNSCPFWIEEWMHSDWWRLWEELDCFAWAILIGIDVLETVVFVFPGPEMSGHRVIFFVWPTEGDT